MTLTQILGAVVLVWAVLGFLVYRAEVRKWL